MAVTFGRLGTTTLNRGVNLTVTPEFRITSPSAPAADVTPNALNWTDIVGNIGGVTNTQTITGIDTSITLRIETNDVDWLQYTSLYIIVNGIQTAINAGGGITPLIDNGYLNVNVNNNDPVYFNATSLYATPANRTIIVKNASNGNVVLDTFTVTLAGDV